jgi:hypothetical protein
VDARRWLGGWRLELLLVASIVLLIIIGSALTEEHWCDGAYHRFQIPDDYGGGGCSRIIPGWHAILPWNWDRMDMVCLGMCTDVPMWEPSG